MARTRLVARLLPPIPEHVIQAVGRRRHAALAQQRHQALHRVLPPGGHLILWEPCSDNYDVAPWMRASVALVDAMLGEPRPLYSKRQLAGFTERAGYDPVEIHDVAGGGTSFIVARRPGS